MVFNVGVVDFEWWFPIRLYAAGGEIRVQWFRRDAGLCFDDRYFHATVARAAKRPFNLAFYRETGVESLAQIANSTAALPLRGMLFHLSRCGSTLVSNAFGARFDVLLLSEAGPINDVLGLPDLSDDARIALLRDVVAVLSRAQRSGQIGCIAKLDAWHVRSLRLFEAAFPGVPWIFLHRDPCEVLVSHLRTPSFMMSALNAHATLGLSVVDAVPIPRETFCSSVIAGILDAMRAAAPGPQRLVAYDELPGAIWTRIGPAFGLPFAESTVARIRAEAGTHAKDPARTFTSDTEEKQAAAQMLPAVIIDRLRAAYAWIDESPMVQRSR